MSRTETENEKQMLAVDRNIVGMVRKNRFQSASKIAVEIENSFGIKLNPQTIRNRNNEEGCNGRKVRKKPALTKRRMKHRLQFAKNYIDMPISYWEKIL
jgi:Transposase